MAVLSPSNEIVEEKGSLFLRPLTNPKLSVTTLTEPKNVTTLQPLTEPKKSVRIESFGQGTMKTRLYLLENMNAR